jgi:hypothetical protein
MTALKAAGPEAESKWKTHPIGGEIRPEAWGQVFDEKPAKKEIQNFRQCVETTHATWLMDSGMFEKKQKPDRIQRAEEQVRRLGYEFYCPGVQIGDIEKGKLEVRLEIENRGVAPFYYDWKPEYALLQDGKPVKTFPGSGKLTGLLPGEKPRVWLDSLEIGDLKTGTYTLAIRVPNPLKTGKPIRFANRTQEANGWLILGRSVIGEPFSVFRFPFSIQRDTRNHKWISTRLN